MSKIVVTGGSGFIGSHIVDRFVDLGDEVVVIDDLSAICHEQFYYNDDAKYYHLSITDELSSFIYKDADYVFHLAAESRIQPALQNPELAISTNVLGTCRVLQFCLEHNVKRFIYSSTSSAYGLNNPIPVKEDMKRDCLNPYSITKTAGEDFARIYYKLYGLETITLRYFNVYGERQPLKGQYAPVVGLFQRQQGMAEPMTVVGDGLQTRDYTYVKDVVEANIKALTAPKEALGEIFNIGTGQQYSVIDLVKLIGSRQTRGSSSLIQDENLFYVHIDERKGEARNTQADISKAEKILGWKPVTRLDDWLNC